MKAFAPPWVFLFGASPALPDEAKPPHVAPPSSPEPEPPPKKSGPWGWLLLLVGIGIGVGIWSAVNQTRVSGPASPLLTARTATVESGVLDRTIRIGGAISAKNFSAIRAPRMSGPGDTGRSQLTLMTLAAPGSLVKAGDIVAKFELKWLEDHIDDRRSSLTVTKAAVEKRKAEIMIERETSRQAMVTAKAEYDKAVLDVRTAEVKSELEAEILKNLAAQADVTWKQIQAERKLKEISHAADIKQLEITVGEDQLHLERHLRDFEKMEIRAPLGGLVVMEPMYKGGGQFQQTAEGDQVYPGSLFMRVVDLSSMVVTASVNQVDVQSIHMGRKAMVRLDAYPDLTLEGRVVGIGAIAEAGGGEGKGGFGRGGSSGLYLKTVPIEIAIDASDPRVIPDLSASADINLSVPQEGLLAPREAVRSENEKTIVYVRKAQGFEPREVELGPASETHVIIRNGLSQGEEILIGRLPPKA